LSTIATMLFLGWGVRRGSGVEGCGRGRKSF